MPEGIHELLVLLHVLALVYWVGADLAVLYSAGYAADPAHSLEARLVISRIMKFVDLFPRMSVPLVGATGVSMAVSTGGLGLHAGGVVAAWLIAIAWIAINARLYAAPAESPSRAFLRRFDLCNRSLVAALTAAAGGAGLFGAGPLESRALALKVLLFSGAVVLSLALRRVFAPFRPALARLVENDGPADANVATMQQSLARARPVVLGIWAFAIAAAAVGLSGPV